MVFLVTDIFSDGFFIQANGTHAVPPRPKTVPCQILRSTQTSSMDQNRRLPFQLTDCMGHAVFGWDSRAQMDVISSGVPFDQVYFKSPTKLLEYSTNFLSDSSIQNFFPVLWDEHDMVSTVPSHVCLCFPFSHKLFLVDRQADIGRAFLSRLATPERSNLFGSRRQRRRFNC